MISRSSKAIAIVTALVALAAFLGIKGVVGTRRLPEVIVPPAVLDDAPSSGSGFPAFPAQFEGIITGTYSVTAEVGVRSYDLTVWYDGVEEFVAIQKVSHANAELDSIVFANGIITSTTARVGGGERVASDAGGSFQSAAWTILGPIALALQDPFAEPIVRGEQSIPGGIAQLVEIKQFNPNTTDDELWIHSISKLPIRRTVSGQIGAALGSVSESWEFSSVTPGTLVLADLPDTDFDPQSDEKETVRRMSLVDLEDFSSIPVYGAGPSISDYEFYEVQYERKQGDATAQHNQTMGIAGDVSEYVKVIYVRDTATFAEQIHYETRPLGQEIQTRVANSNSFSPINIGSSQGMIAEGPGGVTLAIQVSEGEVIISAASRALAELAAAELEKMNP